jgi:hypothetical protein
MKSTTIVGLLLIFIISSTAAQKSEGTTVESRAAYDMEKVKNILDDNSEMALSTDQQDKLLQAYILKYNCIQEARQTAPKTEIRLQMRACNQKANRSFQNILSTSQLSFYREQQRALQQEKLQKMQGKSDREINKLKSILTGDLALSSEQEEAIQQAYKEEQEAYKEAAKYMRNKEKFQKERKTILQTTQQKIQEILTKDQWVAFNKYQ